MDALDALGSPVRREILVALREGPLSVGALAERFPNLQPAFDEFAACLKRRAEAG